MKKRTLKLDFGNGKIEFRFKVIGHFKDEPKAKTAEFEEWLLNITEDTVVEKLIASQGKVRESQLEDLRDKGEY